MRTALTVLALSASLTVAAVAAEKPVATSAPAPADQAASALGAVNAAPIHSRIKGDFAGWDGSTAFTLENGQVWRQVEIGFEYGYSQSPEVTIEKTASGWAMMVAGASKSVAVKLDEGC
jgi:hypothetical protein